MATVQSPPLTDTELLLLTTPNDTGEAPSPSMPDWQWRTVAMLVAILRRHALECGLRWYVAAELDISVARVPNRPSSIKQIEREIAAREAAERDGAEAHAEIRRLRALLGGASEQG